ncbi:cbb3-type cytochrome c oxidase subunit I [Puniceicoccaceae bacterium K14]|nr:cbb3-type cytochrome c oxidase subunit I [Puniceicoccaceae bacterium K14]
MNLISNICSTLCPQLEDGEEARQTERAIDASLRFPTLGLIKGAAVWLVIALAFGIVSFIKLVSPDFMGDSATFTYGKVVPAFWNALVYGFAFNGGLACATWTIGRLTGKATGLNITLVIGIIAWNFSVLFGLGGIFWGDQTPFSLLEFPPYAAYMLLASFALIGFWALKTFNKRIFRSTFAAQWHLVAAVFAFIWILSVAIIMLYCAPVQGVFQGLVAAWYSSNLLGLVLFPMTFAALYYFIPKVFGTPIVGYRYSGIAFWTWMLFTAFSGPAALVNGPVPFWVSSIGVLATFGLLMPTTTLSIQFLSSLLGNFSNIWKTIAGRFLLIGALSFTLYSLLSIYASWRMTNEVIQFSLFDSGLMILGLLGFVGMTLIGGMYYILPRIVNKSLPSNIIDLQFWAQSFGLILMVGSLLYGGYQQGALLNGSSDSSLVTILTVSQSFLFVTILGAVFYLFGAVAFMVSYIWVTLSSRSETEKSAELVKASSDLEYSAS